MKRSAKLCLILMGAIAMPGCGNSQDSQPEAFTSKEQCVEAGNTAEQCQEWLDAALKEQPKFASPEECAQKFGAEACRPHQGPAGNFWMPALLGFMAGQALSGGNIGLFGNPESKEKRFATGAVAPQSSDNNRSNRFGKGSNIGQRVTRGGFTGGGRTSAVS